MKTLNRSLGRVLMTAMVAGLVAAAIGGVSLARAGSGDRTMTLTEVETGAQFVNITHTPQGGPGDQIVLHRVVKNAAGDRVGTLNVVCEVVLGHKLLCNGVYRLPGGTITGTAQEHPEPEQHRARAHRDHRRHRSLRQRQGADHLHAHRCHHQPVGRRPRLTAEQAACARRSVTGAAGAGEVRRGPVSNPSATFSAGSKVAVVSYEGSTRPKETQWSSIYQRGSRAGSRSADSVPVPSWQC